MPKPLLIKDKKAAIEISLYHLLEITLAIIAVFVLIYLSLKLAGLFIGRQEYDSTINNLEVLAARVKELAKDDKPLSAQTMVYSISDNYILVGFNYNDKDPIKTECTGESIVASRPKLCQHTSCLCIFQNFGGVTNIRGKDFDERGDVTPLKCKNFEEKITFLAYSSGSNYGALTQWNPGHYPWTSYYYLVLYGACGLGKILSTSWYNSWGIRQVYLEKYEEGNNIFIFIGDMSDENVVKRSNEIKGRILNSKSI